MRIALSYLSPPELGAYIQLNHVRATGLITSCGTITFPRATFCYIKPQLRHWLNLLYFSTTPSKSKFILVPSVAGTCLETVFLSKEPDPHHQTEEGHRADEPSSVPRALRGFTAPIPDPSEDLVMEEDARALRAEVERINSILPHERPRRHCQLEVAVNKATMRNSHCSSEEQNITWQGLWKNKFPIFTSNGILMLW